MVAKKKILFVIPSFVGGGAERIAALLLTHLNRDNFSPIIVLFKYQVSYFIPEDIPILCLGKKGRFDFPKLIWKLIKVIQREKPDVVISFLTYTNFICILAQKLSLCKSVRLLLTEHSIPSISLNNQRLTVLKKWLVKNLYPCSDLIISVSNGVAKDLAANFAIPESMVRVIYNAVDVERIQKLSKEWVSHVWYKEKTSPILIAVGSLASHKGYFYLLRAFCMVRRNSFCRLVIVGEGDKRKHLEKLSKDLGIDDSVAFLGFQKNPFKFMYQSNLFVLSSLWEGFGNVIIEAMACGIPVVATCCPFGPEEIITDGVNGLLVSPGDEKTLAKAILRLIRDESLRKRLAEAGRKRVEDFRVEKMAKEYETIFGQGHK